MWTFSWSHCFTWCAWCYRIPTLDFERCSHFFLFESATARASAERLFSASYTLLLYCYCSLHRVLWKIVLCIVHFISLLLLLSQWGKVVIALCIIHFTTYTAAIVRKSWDFLCIIHITSLLLLLLSQCKEVVIVLCIVHFTSRLLFLSVRKGCGCPQHPTLYSLTVVVIVTIMKGCDCSWHYSHYLATVVVTLRKGWDCSLYYSHYLATVAAVRKAWDFSLHCTLYFHIAVVSEERL